MVFLGDIAYPGSSSIVSKEIIERFKNKPVVANLEGSLVREPGKFQKDHVLFNEMSVLDQLQQFNLSMLNLANNHIMDLGIKGLSQTQEALSERGIPYVGAGRSIVEAAKSKEIAIGDKSFVFLSFGWAVIECEIATEDRVGVNPLEKEFVLKSVAKATEEYPDSSLIVQFHWNYELERYPQPRHRELAKKLIDSGVDAVIGHHPHIVNGIEIFKGKPIAYSLGNWFIPHGYFWDGRLSYPEEACDQLALEWISGTEEVKCHWFEFDPMTDKINYRTTNDLQHDDKISALTPYAGMEKREYERWFKENRVKRKGLPIYKWEDSKIKTFVNNQCISTRGKLIDILLKAGLK